MPCNLPELQVIALSSRDSIRNGMLVVASKPIAELLSR
jgi:hypothetical protein